ncbi:DUF4232 domain-containing protein [Curtobacterium luteum]|uniref:DUF4232 domain-containing protein n=1 Tax=Curtobacterium luteum TaxID=33881 RepID=UPI0015853EEA|nr:DUF4232 domain-containing protein [Curtobacterium luteum]NUU50254.1 DUF4232 domain-containing protein [Curtobacterium luteum]
MQRRTASSFVSVAVGVFAVGVLAGCAGGGSTTGPTATSASTGAVTTAPTSASGGPSASGSAGSGSSGSGSSGSSSGSGSGSSGSSSSGSGSSSAAGSARCATSALAVGEEPGSGGAAGSTVFHITLENTGTTTCTLQGWPGVSFVGGGTGKQIGAAATLDRSAPHPTVTLKPGQVAVAPLKVGQAGNYSTADCSPVTPDGFRVYPPGSKTSLFLKDSGHQACRAADAPLLSVQAFVPEGQATS